MNIKNILRDPGFWAFLVYIAYTAWAIMYVIHT